MASQSHIWETITLRPPTLRFAKHRVRANPTPAHVRFSGHDLRAILERRTSVRGERDLPDTGHALDAMNAQCRRKYRWILLECRDEHREHRHKCLLQLARQSTELPVEASKPLERRHVYADGSTGKSSSLAATRSRCAANSSSRKIRPSVSRRTSERRSCSGRSSNEPSPRRSTSSYAPATPGSRSVIRKDADAIVELSHAERLKTWQQLRQIGDADGYPLST
jgi:hypothetical protein